MAFDLITLRRSRAWPQMPWEMGPCGTMYPGIPQLRVATEVPTAFTRASRVASAGDFGGDEGRAVKAPRVGVRRKSGAPPGATDHKEREAAVDRWVKVLDELRIAGAVQVKVGQIRMAVIETTAAKATATLNLRFSSWLMFLKWVRDGDRTLHPLEP